ncbi:MAG TPA: tRNA adenosine(34) deaminase TadA [Vicinamibacteria bacterium]|nr:tRNA adenosine(34) deaminase TadA [Vicinamibacteria bacterium]
MGIFTVADQRFMEQALEQARAAERAGEVPIGAVVAAEERILAAAFNQPIRAGDPTAHAEVLALREAAKVLGNYRLPGATVYVTVEPCLMCAGALVNARVARVVYGVAEPKWGALRSLLRLDALPLNHRFEVVEGLLAEECRQLLVEFFRSKRA